VCCKVGVMASNFNRLGENLRGTHATDSWQYGHTGIEAPCREMGEGGGGDRMGEK
jgi:hypothetical protein